MRPLVRPLSAGPWGGASPLHYGLTVLACVAALAVTAGFPAVFERNLFMLFIAVTAVAAALGGIGPALLGVVVSAALVATFHLPAWNAAVVATPVDLAQLELFGVVATTTATVIAGVRSAGRRTLLAANARAAVVETTADAVVTNRSDGTITDVNPAAERLFGYSRSELLDQSVLRLIPPERHEEEHALLRRVLAGERIGHLETERLRRGGQRVEVSISASPLEDADGRVVGMTNVLRDITDRRELERAKDELLAVVSHELRTPLASVVGFAELLLARDYAEAERREFLELMHKEGRRLTALINDFLDLQRLESGREQFTMGHHDLLSLLRHAARTAGDDPLRPIVLDLPEALPPVQMAPDRIQQVVTNLLSNARKYSPHGGTICLSAHLAGEMVEVAVADQGLGIPPEALPGLFVKFFRVDSADRRRIGGTGLGLAIAKQIVEVHGGRIWAESAGPGHGARFAFTLPTAHSANAGADFLIVENDGGFARLLEVELASHGCRTANVRRAEEALVWLRVHRPRGVLLNLHLPGIDGQGFLQRLQTTLAAPVPVVVVTVQDLGPAAVQALNARGATAVVRKGPGVAATAAQALLAARVDVNLEGSLRT